MRHHLDDYPDCGRCVHGFDHGEEAARLRAEVARLRAVDADLRATVARVDAFPIFVHPDGVTEPVMLYRLSGGFGWEIDGADFYARGPRADVLERAEDAAKRGAAPWLDTLRMFVRVLGDPT